MKLTSLVAGLLLAGGAAATAQTLDDLKNDGKNTDNVLTYGMGYEQNRYSPLKQIDKTQRQAAGAGVEPEPRQRVRRAGAADRLQRRDVRRRRQGDRRDRRRRPGASSGRPPVDWPPETPRVVCCGVSNKGVATLRRQGLPHHARRLCGRARRQDRQGDLEAEGRRVEGRLLDDGRAADRQRRAHDRHLRRRVRHPRLHRRLGPADRQAAVAALHHPRPRREGQRDLAANSDAYLHGGGSTWITGSYDPELDLSVLGHRQCRHRGPRKSGPATTSTPLR